VTICLMLLGVPHALTLGVLAGLFEVIPIVGPLVSYVFSLIVSLFLPWSGGISNYVEFSIFWKIIILSAFYTVFQYLENNLLVPRIMGEHLNLHPLTVIFALLVGGMLGGIFGMLIALPIAASLKVAFALYYPSFINRVEELVVRPSSPDEEEGEEVSRTAEGLDERR